MKIPKLDLRKGKLTKEFHFNFDELSKTFGNQDKKILNILERQGAHIEFKNGKVKYFSYATQWEETNTLDKAIENIVKADEEFEGLSSWGYFIKKLEEKLEKEHKENGMQI